MNYDDKMILDPKNDVVFQKIFGSPENEDILISFLNALLERTEKEKINHIEYVDTKLSDIEAIDDKIGILDVRVVTEKGIHINVEIQLINRYNMINRTLFYWSRLYSNQIKKGENYKNLNKTITINILNFNYIDSKKYHTTYHLWEDDEKTKLTDVLEIHFVELSKYLDEQPELNNSLNKWLAFLTKPEKEVMEVVEMGEPEIRKAITVLDTLSRDPETVRLAELRMKKILDEKSMIEGAKEEGKVERNKEIARKALIKGADVSFVSEITGLSEEEILKIENEINNN
ncbi:MULTISPECIES: Rpn family recombination-promoting nuclease/putative transposase [unclassified Clostridium]|uniref:Rpn family recombination-promoting nuclease/putative transposase n=1 Tax=unclassified Clostridium TaxID=2614128 RepID=UPI001FA82772|nr:MULTISPECIES: Rpn family recombination-promoting nuclease/putative transposase [unclassified Clostridium]